MQQESSEFALFENYLLTLHNLQSEIVEEIEQFQLVQSQQASNYERLSESFTMLRRVKEPSHKQASASKEENALNSSNLSMQMDSINPGSQTAEFGRSGASGPASMHSLSENDQTTGFYAIVEEICQTFTTVRDHKRKEALEVLSHIVQSAKYHCDSTKAAHEAVQRYKALAGKKYEIQNKVRILRDQSNQRACTDAELIKLEEFHGQVTGSADQARQQIKMEISRFKRTKASQTKFIVQEFQQAQAVLAKQVHSAWESHSGVMQAQIEAEAQALK